MNKVSLPCKLGNRTKSLPALRRHTFERHSKYRKSVRVINISVIGTVHIRHPRYHQTWDFIITPHDKAVPLHHMQTKSLVATLIIPLDDSVSSSCMAFLWKIAKRMRQEGVYKGKEDHKVSPFFAVLILSITLITSIKHY